MLSRVSLFLKSVALSPGAVSVLLGTTSGLVPHSWGQTWGGGVGGQECPPGSTNAGKALGWFQLIMLLAMIDGSLTTEM